MDSAQKRAILAILGMIESGIIQLKMLLSSDGPDSYVVGPAPRSSGDSQHLSFEEEKLLEKQLEIERQELINFEQHRAQSLWSGSQLDPEDDR